MTAEERQQRWREAHPGLAAERARAWVAANPERARANARRYYEDHKETMNERSRAYGRYNAEAVRRTHRFKKYGLTPEEHDALFEAQGGVCAICGQPERGTNRGKPKALAVDHDHATGRVRGLLCGPCNQAIGMFQEDTVRMMAAAAYIVGAAA